MIDNFWVSLQIFLILTLFSYFLFTLYTYFRPLKSSKIQDIETELWMIGEKELSIIFKKGARPNQFYIDEIKKNIERYHEMVLAYIKESDEYKKYANNTLILEGISFPALENELNEFDFSIDFLYGNEDESFLVAYIKNEKVLRLVVSP